MKLNLRKVAWSAVLLVAALLPVTCFGYDIDGEPLGGLRSVLGDWTNGNFTVVTPARKLYTWQFRQYGVSTDAQGKYHRFSVTETMKRVSATGGYVYKRTTIWDGAVTNSTAPFGIDTVGRTDYHCHPGTPDDPGEAYVDLNIVRTFTVAAWMGSTVHVGKSPKAPYTTWLRMDGGETQTSCADIPPHTRVFRNVFSLPETGMVVRTYGSPNYSYDWLGGLLWSGKPTEH